MYLSGSVATLNEEINGLPGGLPGGVDSPKFAGLHRIERGLWTQTPPRELVGASERLDLAVQRLQSKLPHVSLTPLEYVTRAHEILEDALRDLLTGVDVPWSGEGVLATKAGLDATEEVVRTLRPLFGAGNQVIRVVATELSNLRSVIAQIAAAHGGHLPTNGQLPRPQSERLEAALGGALEALAELPGQLETEAPAPIPSIPAADARSIR